MSVPRPGSGEHGLAAVRQLLGHHESVAQWAPTILLAIAPGVFYRQQGRGCAPGAIRRDQVSNMFVRSVTCSLLLVAGAITLHGQQRQASGSGSGSGSGLALDASGQEIY